MSCSMLESLPGEVLHQIVEYLRKDDLKALATTSRLCYASALPLALRSIDISIAGRRWLREDVDTWLATLNRTGCHRHVRELRLRGAMPQTSNDESLESGVEKNARKRRFPEGSDLIRDDDAWSPIIDLLKVTLGLTDLVYRCRNRMNTSLIHALSRRLPCCRLHVPSFNSLRGFGEPAEITDDLTALATSPNLYSIQFTGMGIQDQGRRTFSQELALRTIAGTCANLRRVRFVQHSTSLPAWGDRELDSATLMRWDAAFGVPSALFKGALHSLELVGEGTQRVGTFGFFSKATDCRALRELTLANSLGVAPEELAWAANSARFDNLTELHLNLELSRNSSAEQFAATDAAAPAFITSLPPLKALTIFCYLTQGIFDGILQCHGTALRELRIDTRLLWQDPRYSTRENFQGRTMPLCLSRVAVDQLQRQCPQLEELRIPIRRSRSDSDEVAIYQALSKMNRLKVLEIALDWRHHWDLLMEGQDLAVDPSFDEFERQPVSFVDAVNPSGCRVLNGHVKQALQHAALDADLAVSIWDTIRSRGSGLRQLVIRIDSVDDALRELGHPVGLGILVAHLARSYDVRSSESIVDEPRPLVSELSKQGREELDEALFCTRSHVAQELQGEDSALYTFERLWPRKENTTSWRDDWASIPLQGTTAESPLQTVPPYLELPSRSCDPQTGLQRFLIDDAEM